jgi:hypothetical protein
MLSKKIVENSTSAGSNLALDKMMLRFSGRSALIFIQLPKPTPNGLKMIAIVDSPNYYFFFRKNSCPMYGLVYQKKASLLIFPQAKTFKIG